MSVVCTNVAVDFTHIQRAGVGVAVSHGSFRRLMRDEWHNSEICLMFLCYRLKKISKVGKFRKGS